MRPYLPVALALICCESPKKVDAGEPHDVKRLAAFTDARGDDCPSPRGMTADVPGKDEWQKVLAAFAREPAPDGAFEVVAVRTGCARLVERRQGGFVRQWELWVKNGPSWTLSVSWQFAPEVKRPTCMHRVALAGLLPGGGELYSPEVVSKTLSDGTVYTRADLEKPCPNNMTHCGAHPNFKLWGYED